MSTTTRKQPRPKKIGIKAATLRRIQQRLKAMAQFRRKLDPMDINAVHELRQISMRVISLYPQKKRRAHIDAITKMKSWPDIIEYTHQVLTNMQGLRHL